MGHIYYNFWMVCSMLLSTVYALDKIASTYDEKNKTKTASRLKFDR